MRYNGSLSDDDRKEIYEDVCAAYQSGEIGLVEFSSTLAEIGQNATDIAEAEKFYRPTPPEDEGDSDDS